MVVEKNVHIISMNRWSFKGFICSTFSLYRMAYHVIVVTVVARGVHSRQELQIISLKIRESLFDKFNIYVQCKVLYSGHYSRSSPLFKLLRQLVIINRLKNFIAGHRSRLRKEVSAYYTALAM